MVVIWRGLGFLVPVNVFGCSLAANLAFNATVGDEYYDHHKWPFAASLIVSACICWFLGGHLRKRSAQVVMHKQTGEEMVINRSGHDLFFIPMHSWAPILLIGAFILLGIEFLH